MNKVTEKNWTEYFDANLQRRLKIRWENGMRIGENEEAIVASLQRFQIGVSGEGNQLKK